MLKQQTIEELVRREAPAHTCNQWSTVSHRVWLMDGAYPTGHANDNMLL